jgi:quercetin dioxygenase-like cupin family protein
MTTRPHPESERPLRGPLQSFNLAAEVTHLREEKAWQEGRRNAITLRKGEGLNVVLLVMKEGDRLDEHCAPGLITLSVHEGRIRFSAADEDVEAEAGTVLACDAGVRPDTWATPTSPRRSAATWLRSDLCSSLLP